MAVADGLVPEAVGLVLVSYPLHPPGKPDKLRVARREKTKRSIGKECTKNHRKRNSLVAVIHPFHAVKCLPKM
jgi:hypothetical protein